jgi:hypothetical protein
MDGLKVVFMCNCGLYFKNMLTGRPRLNAMANTLKGKGTERVAHYGEDAVELYFLDIANIHVVRTSLQAVAKVGRAAKACKRCKCWSYSFDARALSPLPLLGFSF